MDRTGLPISQDNQEGHAKESNGLFMRTLIRRSAKGQCGIEIVVSFYLNWERVHRRIESISIFTDN